MSETHPGLYGEENDIARVDENVRREILTAFFLENIPPNLILRRTPIPRRACPTRNVRRREGSVLTLRA